MISHAYIHGGLGNQMFQYAAAFAHSRKMGVDLFYPVKPYRPNTTDCFNLYEVFHLSSKKVGRVGPNYQEPKFQYTPIPDLKVLTLHGYYQSERYFENCKEEIRKEFTFRKKSNTVVKPNTTSIHVRRGDYLKFPEHHPLCSMDYYNSAISMFEDQNFLVFSDDIKWCKENFKGDKFTFCEGNSSEEDLQIMAKCDNHIMANSSFSWWGAWLGTNQDKVIVSPKKWFGKAYEDWASNTSDLYPPKWVVL